MSDLIITEVQSGGLAAFKNHQSLLVTIMRHYIYPRAPDYRQHSIFRPKENVLAYFEFAVKCRINSFVKQYKEDYLYWEDVSLGGGGRIVSEKLSYKLTVKYKPSANFVLFYEKLLIFNNLCQLSLNVMELDIFSSFCAMQQSVMTWSSRLNLKYIHIIA